MAVESGERISDPGILTFTISILRLTGLLLLTLPCAVAADVQQYHRHDFSSRAAVPSNPFDVLLSAEFTGPSGVRLSVPGFYDGDGTWKVRFSPTEIGNWSMTTSSGIDALNGQTATISCLANRHPQIHARLEVDPANPHQFVYQDGTRYFPLGYEADWLWGADPLDPQRRLMHTLIEQMASRGFNHDLSLGRLERRNPITHS